jgi:hypothetical protein
MAIQLIVVAIALAAACLMSLAMPTYGDGTATRRARTHLTVSYRTFLVSVLGSIPVLSTLRNCAGKLSSWISGRTAVSIASGRCRMIVRYLQGSRPRCRRRSYAEVLVRKVPPATSKRQSIATAPNNRSRRTTIMRHEAPYHNHYWPAQFIIDKSGKIVFEHAGEGRDDELKKRSRNSSIWTTEEWRPRAIGFESGEMVQAADPRRGHACAWCFALAKL